MTFIKELIWVIWDLLKSFGGWLWDLIGTEQKPTAAEIVTTLAILAVLYFGLLALWAVLA